MNPSTPSNLAAISSLHAHFKSQGLVVFRSSSQDTMRPSLHRISFDMKDATGTTLLNVTLELDLDEVKLRSALSTVDPEGLLNILDNEDRMDGFMEMRAFEVIQHLRSFNGMADDYDAIARLVHQVRGAAHAKKYNI